MTITLDIPDETWQAVERMAERFQTSPKERLEKLVALTHTDAVVSPKRSETLEELDRRLDEEARQRGDDPDAVHPLVQSFVSRRAARLEELARTEPNEKDVTVTRQVLDLLERAALDTVK